VQSVHLLPAVVSVMLNPTKPTFKVTAKDESISVARLSEISRPFFVIFAILFIAFLMSIYRFYSEPYKADVTFVVGAWNLLNLIIAGCALGVVSERSEKAASRRVTVKRRCTFAIYGRDYPATLENVSANGARVQVFGLEQDMVLGAHGFLRFTPYSANYEATLPIDVKNIEQVGSVVAIGCRFMPQEARHHSLVADLIFANSNQWSDFQVSRRYNPGLFRGSLWFLGVAAYQTSRGLIYFARSIGGGRKGEASR
jgi:cellulose synthase (UDP-forming)